MFQVGSFYIWLLSLVYLIVPINKRDWAQVEYIYIVNIWHSNPIKCTMTSQTEPNRTLPFNLGFGLTLRIPAFDSCWSTNKRVRFDLSLYMLQQINHSPADKFDAFNITTKWKSKRHHICVWTRTKSDPIRNGFSWNYKKNYFIFY